MGDEDDVEKRACAAYSRFPDKCWWKGANAKKPQWTRTTADRSFGVGEWVCGAHKCVGEGRGIRDRTKPPQLPPPLALPQQPLVPPPAPAATAAAGPPPTASVAPRRAPARASAREAGASGSSSTGAAPGASVHP
eukprot:scaffold9643_cov54-Phaeocystis_antarctica.AAC.1